MSHTQGFGKLLKSYPIRKKGNWQWFQCLHVYSSLKIPAFQKFRSAEPHTTTTTCQVELLESFTVVKIPPFVFTLFKMKTDCKNISNSSDKYCEHRRGQASTLPSCPSPTTLLSVNSVRWPCQWRHPSLPLSWIYIYFHVVKRPRQDIEKS